MKPRWTFVNLDYCAMTWLHSENFLDTKAWMMDNYMTLNIRLKTFFYFISERNRIYHKKQQSDWQWLVKICKFIPISRAHETFCLWWIFKKRHLVPLWPHYGQTMPHLWPPRSAPRPQSRPAESQTRGSPRCRPASCVWHMLGCSKSNIVIKVTLAPTHGGLSLASLSRLLSLTLLSSPSIRMMQWSPPRPWETVSYNGNCFLKIGLPYS